jgi:paraquat-inducible protein A
MPAHHKAQPACHHCGRIHGTAVGAEAEFGDANKDGDGRHPNLPRWLDHATAYTLTAAVLFVISISFPFLALEALGMRQEASILTGVVALADHGRWLLAALVFITIVFMPLLEILGLLYLLISYRSQRCLPGQITVFRWLVTVQPWSMLEIFALAVLVSLVKLAETAAIVPGAAMFSFFLVVAALLGAYVKIDRRQIWTWLSRESYFVEQAGEPVFECSVCRAMIGRSILQREHRCPRCQSRIHERIPHSIQKTAALLLASAILYIPANVLPIMSFTSFGVTRTDTIFSGVVALISEGSWWAAVVVFVASIVVPIAKLVVLTYLLWAVKLGVKLDARHQQTLFRSIEIIGRWSMVDVFVVTLLVALVQFGLFGYVEPRGAIVAFGGVVVLTMLATQTFDPRLLQDAQDNH